jgi:hypothetical protein
MDKTVCTRDSSCPALRPRLAGTALLAIACAAAAQGVAPGELPAEGYKLPGGIEPVLHLRSYYFDQESLAGDASTAWALGGWAGLRSPWWGDAVQLGVVGYTSQRLYGPEDKSGTLLLQPNRSLPCHSIRPRRRRPAMPPPTLDLRAQSRAGCWCPYPGDAHAAASAGSSGASTSPTWLSTTTLQCIRVICGGAP